MAATTVASGSLFAKGPEAFNPQDPEEGVYLGVPPATYHMARAVNRSLLSVLTDRSPWHFREAFEGRVEGKVESDAMRLGSLEHLLVLEPHRFAETVVPAPINEKTGRAYGCETKAWVEFAAAHRGKIVATDEDIESARKMAKSFHEHPAIGPLIRNAAATELTLVASLCGVKCKVRVDVLPEWGGALLLDLKTTKNAGERAFAASIANFGYDMQAAMYTMIAQRLGVLNPNDANASLALAAVDVSDGNQCAMYIPDPKFMEIASVRVKNTLAVIEACRRVNNWPSYPLEPVFISPPAWYIARFTDGE